MKTAIQELFSQLEIEHPNLFNTNTLEGRKFINDYYKFFELEKLQIETAYNNGWRDKENRTKGNKYFGDNYYNDNYKTN